MESGKRLKGRAGRKGFVIGGIKVKQKPKNIDYALLIKAEKLRFQSDFSAAHWLNLVISDYSTGNLRPKIQEAYATVLMVAIHAGIKAALKKVNEYPDFLGFPAYLKLDGGKEWGKTQKWVCDNFETHLKNRFGYFRDRD